MRLEQVVVNLLTNAAKYTTVGGTIAIWTATEDGQALLHVRDNGTGINPELLPRVFDLFLQGNRVPSARRAALGLG
jgi:signal transduction histidine kinase